MARLIRCPLAHLEPVHWLRRCAGIAGGQGTGLSPNAGSTPLVVVPLQSFAASDCRASPRRISRETPSCTHLRLERCECRAMVHLLTTANFSAAAWRCPSLAPRPDIDRHRTLRCRTRMRQPLAKQARHTPTPISTPSRTARYRRRADDRVAPRRIHLSAVVSKASRLQLKPRKFPDSPVWFPCKQRRRRTCPHHVSFESGQGWNPQEQRVAWHAASVSKGGSANQRAV